MNPLLINPTDVSFSVILDQELGVFEFVGKSRPEDSTGFFEPVFKWFDNYLSDPNPTTLIVFKLDYYNSSSAKVLLRLLVRFEQLIEEGFEVKINWYYRKNDEDILESGEDFSTMVNIPFEFIEL
jgi:hypothetical protein